MTIEATLQRLEIGTIVDLYELDFNPIGVDLISYFTPSENLGNSIWFGGIEYVSRAIQFTGFERSAEGQPPEPTLSMSNVDKGGNALLASYEDLLGVKVTRRRTLAEFLDFLPDGVTENPSADPNARILDEVWFIEQKTDGNPIFIQWKLKSVMDLDGIEVPRRRVLKNVCEREYRTFNGVDDFTYSLVNACPYTEAEMFKRDGTTTTIMSEDDCPKNISGCLKRFPLTELPAWFFPGANRMPG